jgi:hypothetical protein
MVPSEAGASYPPRYAHIKWVIQISVAVLSGANFCHQATSHWLNDHFSTVNTHSLVSQLYLNHQPSVGNFHIDIDFPTLEMPFPPGIPLSAGRDTHFLRPRRLAHAHSTKAQTETSGCFHQLKLRLAGREDDQSQSHSRLRCPHVPWLSGVAVCVIAYSFAWRP